MAMKVKSLVSQKFFGNTFKPIRKKSDVAEIFLMSSPLLGLALMLIVPPICLLLGLVTALLSIIVVPITLIAYLITTLIMVINFFYNNRFFDFDDFQGLLLLALIVVGGIVSLPLLLLGGAFAAFLIGALDTVLSLVALPLQLVTRTLTTFVKRKCSDSPHVDVLDDDAFDDDAFDDDAFDDDAFNPNPVIIPVAGCY